MPKMRQKDRERVVTLYLRDKNCFSKEKQHMIEEKMRLEKEEYSYDASDPELYEFLESLADEIYQLSINIGLYHWVEDNFKKDALFRVRSTSETPSKIIHRWSNRDYNLQESA